MKIAYIDIKNFRKLKVCRIEFSGTNTLFVGANNSGKTSAMDALAKFLGNKSMSFNDITLSNRILLDKLGAEWISDSESFKNNFNKIDFLLPSLDVWIEVSEKELHYVSHIIPTLDWQGGILGVRLLLKPKKVEELYSNFLDSYNKARTIESSSKNKVGLDLWPKTLSDFLERKFANLFSLTPYILDVEKKDIICQPTNYNAECLNRNPLMGLMKVDMIAAQRGFSDPDTNDDSGVTQKSNLSSQLRLYYDKHLDPEKEPTEEDLEILEVMKKSNDQFDMNLADKFKDSIRELEDLGYPGFGNPKLHVETKVSASDTLKHDSAVQYSLEKTHNLRLPEKYNGLGYQNLISMIFLLMRFRDDWMRVGKAKNESENSIKIVPPLHLVLIEEPEAHLHVQVQQVFIKKAYGVLRNHKRLENDKQYTTQLIISTHSSHIAREEMFSNLRYFKRVEAQGDCNIPTSSVINLSDVFGNEKNQTNKFITRYLLSTHCELFFADAAILVEGSAEYMLVPHFIKNKHPKLEQKYITLLNINGRHAYKLRPLIEKLSLTTLIISDVDSSSPDGRHPSKLPQREAKLISSNFTIYDWFLKRQNIGNSLDNLLDLPSENKIITELSPYNYSVRVAYQTPIIIQSGKYKDEEALCTTFEDSLIYSNICLFEKSIETDEQVVLKEDELKSKFEKNSFVKKVNLLLKKQNDFNLFHTELYDSIKSEKFKAEFALDLIFEVEPSDIEIPTYIEEGLVWLTNELTLKEGVTEIE